MTGKWITVKGCGKEVEIESGFLWPVQAYTLVESALS
jgi:hypothetical protein